MLAIFFLYIIKRLIFVKEELIFGVYRKNTRWYWPKFILLFTLLSLQKFYFRITGKKNKEDFGKLYEKPQDLSEFPELAADSVFFTGANSKGYRILFSIERRKHGVYYGVVYFVIPSLGMLKLPRTPDTIFFTNFGQESRVYGQTNFKATCIEPLKKWALEYNGPLVNELREEFQVQFSAEFSSSFDVFSYETDLNVNALANTIALEKWTSPFLSNLGRPNQRFYEQMGKLSVNLSIDGKSSEFQLQGFRDHGFGKIRDWGAIHRYALFILFLKNNTSLHVGFACQPNFLSNLLVGYMCAEDGKYYPVDSSNFELYQNGENGNPPRDHAFQFTANDTVYTVQLKYEREFEHFVGDNWDARIIDRFVECNVNDIPGFGVVEYEYCNKTGRPDAYTENDPEGFGKITKQKIN